MTRVGDIMRVMNAWAPSTLAEPWDNPGLAAGDPNDPADTVLIALDVTEETLDAASMTGATMIVSHHPAIFKPLSSLAGNSLQVRTIRRAVREGVALFSAHTNLDKASQGVSHAAAMRLGLHHISPLVPHSPDVMKFVTYCPPSSTDRIREAAGSAGAGIIGSYTLCSFTSKGYGTFLPSENSRPYSGTAGVLSREQEDRIEMIAPKTVINRIIDAVRAVHPYEEMAYDVIPLANMDGHSGFGAVGELSEPMDSRSFLSHVASSFGTDCLRISASAPQKIRRVAVVGGSGSGSLSDAIRMESDAFITGDIGHHSFLDAPDTLLLIDATHRATELPVLDVIDSYIQSSFGGAVRCSVFTGAVIPTVLYNPLSRHYTIPHEGVDIPPCISEDRHEE